MPVAQRLASSSHAADPMQLKATALHRQLLCTATITLTERHSTNQQSKALIAAAASSSVLAVADCTPGVDWTPALSPACACRVSLAQS